MSDDYRTECLLRHRATFFRVTEHDSRLDKRNSSSSRGNYNSTCTLSLKNAPSLKWYLARNYKDRFWWH